MGILDKLFGLKKKEAPKKPENKNKPLLDLPVKNPEPYDYKKVLANIRARVQQAASKVPGAEKYILEQRQEECNARAMGITEFTPISKKRFVVFDLETTGLNPSGHEIVEIGAVRVENGEITAEYSTLVNPDYKISEEASAVNHITADMLVGKPKIYEVLPEFLVFVGDDVLAGHNVMFDFKFLAQACMVNFLKPPEVLFDTMTLARYYPESGSKKLTALAKAAGIEVGTAHRALDDAKLTAKLILATNEKRKK